MSASTETFTAAPSASKRMISLDILRGITIGFMIMVNNNGDWGHSWWFMEHSEWNGLTPTDLVFPTFLFVVGVSLVFSFASRLERHATRSSLMGHVQPHGDPSRARGHFPVR